MIFHTGGSVFHNHLRFGEQLTTYAYLDNKMYKNVSITYGLKNATKLKTKSLGQF